MTGFTSELVRICRHFTVLERETVCCGTVTVPQCLVLQQLLDGPQEMTALASQSGASVSAMTRLVDGLERREWIARRRSKDDRRRVEVALTAAGNEEATKLRGVTSDAIATVLQRIPKAKHKQVLESIVLVRKAMDEARDALRGCCAC